MPFESLGEAMRQRAKAGGKPIKAGRRKATSAKRSNPPKSASPHKSSATGDETEVARLRRELNEALAQQTATSEVLKVISSSPGALEPVFNAILQNAVRICGAHFGNLALYEGTNMRLAAMHNAPHEFEKLRRSDLTVPLTVRRWVLLCEQKGSHTLAT